MSHKSGSQPSRCLNDPVAPASSGAFSCWSGAPMPQPTVHEVYFKFQDGIGFSFGVFLPNLNDYFGVTKAATAVIFSIMSFLIQVCLKLKYFF